VAARDFVATVVAKEPIFGETAVLTFSCPPSAAAAAQAGRLVRVFCRDRRSYDPWLPRSFFLFDASPAEETLAVLVRPGDRADAWLADREPGDRLEVAGLTGSAIGISPATVNLLLVAGGDGIGPLVFLARQAVESGRNVTFLVGGASDADLLPPSALPASVEYQAATEDGSRGERGSVTDLVPGYVRWADQVVGSGPAGMYGSLRRNLRALQVGGKPTAQVVVERPMPCGFGVCRSCMVDTRRGQRTVCLDGPAFDLDEVVW
jgi:dihydroorotate dehydrogenase electron transfer subunit